MDALGRHIILEMWRCCNDIISNVDSVKEILTEAAKSVQATLVDIVCHQFSPYGVTGVIILAESHISVHTWPEYGYAAADIFICGGNIIHPQNAASFIMQAFRAKETSLLEFKRGHLPSKKIQNDKMMVMNGNVPDPRSPICL